MVKEIPLTQGQVALVDDEDFEWLNQSKWYYSLDGYTGYAVRGSSNKEQSKMHRVILNAPSGMEGHHVNGDGLDNQRSNLRLCTHSQHEMTRGKRLGGSSRWKGVWWDKGIGKWRVLIEMRGTKHYLGYFVDEDDAARAYNKAAKEYFGDFAWLNPVPERQEKGDYHATQS